MKLSKAKVMEWNEKAGNGFTFDVQKALMWGEKELVKRIKVGADMLLEVKLQWKSAGVGIGVFPVIHFQEWKNEQNGMISSWGFGQDIRIGDIAKRKNFSWLLKYSNDEANHLDDESLLKRWHSLDDEAYEYAVYGNYGSGWEYICTGEDKADAERLLKEYNKNEIQFAHCIKKKRNYSVLGVRGA